MSEFQHDITDHHDRLLDLALRETLGNESPPDLKEGILAAAKTQAMGDTFTFTRGANSMNDMQSSVKKSRFPWLQVALAASLLVGIGWVLMPREQSSRERAQVLPSEATKQDTNHPVMTNDSLGDSSQQEQANRKTERERQIAQTEKQHGYYTTRGPHDFYDSFSPSTVPAQSVDDLKMMVTPHIIMQEEEKAQIGGVEGKSQVAKHEPPFSSFARAIRNDSFAGESLRQEFQRGALSSLHGQKPVDGRSLYRLHSINPSSGPAIDSEGRGPGKGGDQYTRIHENSFVVAEGEKAVSTFSIDVDTASYANVRQFLMQSGQLPPLDAVRIEELVNYFDYDYSGPTGGVPFAANVEVAGCPWQPEHRLVRIGIKGREIERQRRPQSNLVFLIDVSGSMNQPNKLPLLVEGMKLLTRELGENDRVAIVVYASSEGLALPSTSGDEQETILAALDQLRAGGSTAGGAGIELAYKTAKKNFITGGVNRVILATDGDFNVGVTSPAELERMAETKAKETGIFLTVLGFGRGNLNDAMMEKISGKGNGNYHYVDNRMEARKVLVEEMAGTLVTIAKDVKIQIEFNPAQVAGYRLIGYENRMLATEDFNDDKKDAGEIGAGHTVTALYEIVPAGKSVSAPGVDPLKYQTPAKTASGGVDSDEMLTLKIRYKKPDGEKSTKLEFPVTDNGQTFAAASGDFQFAAAVASFGMLLRDSEHRGNTSFDAVLEIAESGMKRDPHGYRAEFLTLVRKAKQLRGE